MPDLGTSVVVAAKLGGRGSLAAFGAELKDTSALSATEIVHCQTLDERAARYYPVQGRANHRSGL